MRYLMDGEDKRECEVTFEKVSENETRVTETFDPESINPADMQQAGWQATLDNFKNTQKVNNFLIRYLAVLKTVSVTIEF